MNADERDADEGLPQESKSGSFEFPNSEDVADDSYVPEGTDSILVSETPSQMPVAEPTPFPLSDDYSSPVSTPTTPSAEQEFAPVSRSKKPQWIRLLGRGGFGEVWQVRYIGRDEAWKKLPKDRVSDVRALEEAFNARRIEHSNVAQVFEIYTTDTHYILRMELVRGRDLQQVIDEDGALDPSTACQYVIQIADALEAAHSLNIVHQDVKPSNAILREDGESVVVTDFGIARNIRGGAVEGGVAGTPYYLSPEQVESIHTKRPFGPQIDVWALGVTLFHLISRKFPFPFKDGKPDAVLQHEAQSLREAVPYVSERLSSVVEKMLKRDLSERFGSVREVRDALKAYVDSVDCPACGETVPLPAEIVDALPERNVRGAQARLSARRTVAGGGAASKLCSRAATYDELDETIDELERVSPEAADSEISRLRSLRSKLADELAERLALITATEEAGNLVQTLKTVDGARRSFSGCSQLIDKHNESTQQVSRSRYENATDELRVRVRETRFDEAKSLLDLILEWSRLRTHCAACPSMGLGEATDCHWILTRWYEHIRQRQSHSTPSCRRRWIYIGMRFGFAKLRRRPRSSITSSPSRTTSAAQDSIPSSPNRGSSSPKSAPATCCRSSRQATASEETTAMAIEDSERICPENSLHKHVRLRRGLTSCDKLLGHKGGNRRKSRVQPG